MRRIPLLTFLLLSLALAGLPEKACAAQAPVTPEQRLAAEEARRERILLNAVRQAFTPPAAGLTPNPEEIPMSWGWEDPAWDTPVVLSVYRNPYSYANNLDSYLPCLKEALEGNPKAMLAVSMYAYLWGYELKENYPDFPPEVHNPHYWRSWASRLTNPGWVLLRLGDLHGRWPQTALDYYRQAAELGNGEAMFHYYQLTGKRKDYLYRSAALGYPRASFLAGEELEKLGGAENLELARRYIWLAALNADDWGLLHSSFAFYNGVYTGEFDSCEQGYLYALLSVRYQFGGVFPVQGPENLCMLTESDINRVEAEADRWQASLDDRRLPYIERHRYQKAPEVAAFQAEQAPLMERLGVKRAGPLVRTAPARARAARPESGTSLSWHLGFYDEEEEGQAYVSGRAKGSDFPLRHNRLLGSRYLSLVYAFVGLTMFSGAALIFYGQWLKKRRYRSRSENGKSHK